METQEKLNLCHSTSVHPDMPTVPELPYLSLKKKEKIERVPENTELCFLSLKYPIDVFICRTFVLFDVVRLFFIILCVFAVSNTFSISIYTFYIVQLES